MNQANRFFSMPLLLLFLLLLGCSKSENPQPSTTAAPQKAPAVVDKATAGSVTGTISLTGTPPKFPPLDMSADPACPPTPQPGDVVVVKNGKLANVFVYVKEGLGQASFPAPTDPVTFDQKGCRYAPHVVGLMVGQPLKILNSDNAGHNVHPMPKNNRE